MEQMEKERQEREEEEEDEELEMDTMRKANYTADDLIAGMDTQMKIQRKKKKNRAEKDESERIARASKPIAKAGEKIAALKKKHKNKRSRS